MAVRSTNVPFTAASLNFNKGHVAADLNPYAYVYTDCKKSDGMYATMDEWKRHINNCHRVNRRFCVACWPGSDIPVVFELKPEKERHDHKVTAHNGEYDEIDLQDMDDASRKRVASPVSCPLCFGITPLLRPQTDSHITKQLHFFAPQTLPLGTIGPDDDTQTSVNPDILRRLHLQTVTISSQT